MALDEATSPTADSPIDFQNSRKHDGGKPLPTDSMVTVPLSPTESSNPVQSLDAIAAKPEITVNKTRDSRIGAAAPSLDEAVMEKTEEKKNDTPEDSAAKPRSRTSTIVRSRSGSSGSADSGGKVDWEELDKKEEQIEQDAGSDENTALLLARLEQENQALATDPKNAASKARSRSQSRPPSMNQLKKMVEDQNNSESVRFSLLPSPPPMTELEFWAALVRDYTGTAQRLPTLTSNKIRAGIPAPLRGVTWVSMAGARDRGIEEQYERLCTESSPYENMIGKDIGRSFPGVEMFRDPEGEGQKMLGRVLKCFSLYDDKIGYCQGLGFLVGPLLMQMGDKEAFCVLVRLMEDYDLRSCFLPDLSGLHLRIYQFRRLMQQLIPELYAHLETMNIEAAYLSQWFLSFFAVTCPLPMLFRIYDVIFAEGASETIMRVALAIMRKNEQRLLAFTEFEDVIQLLLSRSLWDPYGCNQQSADDLVNDFCSFTSVVTREHLQALEASFRDASSDETASKGFFPEVQNAAQRFLGRIWGPDKRNTTATLSPPADKPSRPVSFMKRTASKQSIASTLNSVDGSDSTGRSHNSTATAMTELTNRESDAMSVKSMKMGNVRNTMMSHHDRDLHSQIEDLLTALSEMQREHASLAAQLQKEREDRREDHRVVRSLVERVKQDKGITTTTKAQRRRTSPLNSIDDLKNKRMSTPPSLTSNEDFQGLVEKIEMRFPAKAQHNRSASVFETKQYLRESLARSKEQLHLETTRSQSLSRQLLDAETETASLRTQLDETRHRLQASMVDRQRLERSIQDLKAENQKARKASTWSGSESDVPSLTRSDTADSISSSTSGKGLREFKLGRSNTTRSISTTKTRNSFGRIAPTPNTSAVAPVPQRSSSPHTSASPMFAKRSSSLSAHAALSSSPPPDPSSDDALLLELVNAKTAEAVARQELEELRARFESMRKMLGVATPSPNSSTSGLTPSKSATSENGFFTSSSKPPGSSHSTASTNNNSGGGFWGWGKRSVSTTAAEAK